MCLYWWWTVLNETLLECVKRETFEETGIILSDEDIEFCKLYDDPSIIIAYPDGNIIRSMMALYEATLKKMPDLRCSEESVELRFFSKEELKNIKIVETYTPILEDYFAECTTSNLYTRLTDSEKQCKNSEIIMEKSFSFEYNNI